MGWTLVTSPLSDIPVARLTGKTPTFAQNIGSNSAEKEQCVMVEQKHRALSTRTEFALAKRFQVTESRHSRISSTVFTWGHLFSFEQGRPTSHFVSCLPGQLKSTLPSPSVRLFSLKQIKMSCKSRSLWLIPRKRVAVWIFTIGLAAQVDGCSREFAYHLFNLRCNGGSTPRSANFSRTARTSLLIIELSFFIFPQITVTHQSTQQT